MRDMSNQIEREVPTGFHYVQEVHQTAIHHFYISGEIGPPNYYIEMIHIIRTASPHDCVYLHLNTTGGQLDTGIQIINAMRESAAHIICSIEAQAFSLGSMIFLCGDDFIVHDNAMLMIHNFNGAMAGKGNEQRLRLEAVTTLFDQFVRPIYIPFLTDEEFDSVIDGKDIWLHSEAIKDRLDIIADTREKEMLAEQKLLEAEAKPVTKKPATKRKPRAKKAWCGHNFELYFQQWILLI